MSVLLLPLIIVATLIVILSGVWVTFALIDAIWHVPRHAEDAPVSNSGQAVGDTGKNIE